MTACRYVALDQPRVLANRHLDGCGDDQCRGCAPCPDDHCLVCSRVHATVTCPECIAATRDDLTEIADLCGALPDEARHRGVHSEAMMLTGPVADPEAWQWRALSAMRGRADDAYLEDCRDELHPLWVLGSWADLWRDALDQPTDLRITIDRALAYLDGHLHQMAGRIEPDFPQFVAEVRACRRHLEDVLRDGIRDETGAPCVQCERPMVRLVTDSGAQDAYECRRCHRHVAGDQYRYAVSVAYLAVADCLTAVQLGERFGIKPSVIRVWGSRGLVRKRGRGADGATLYDAGDVEARALGTSASAM